MLIHLGMHWQHFLITAASYLPETSYYSVLLGIHDLDLARLKSNSQEFSYFMLGVNLILSDSTCLLTATCYTKFLNNLHPAGHQGLWQHSQGYAHQDVGQPLGDSVDGARVANRLTELIRYPQSSFIHCAA